MGLDIRTPSHHATWSYGGFHDFRARIAGTLGIDYDTTEGWDLDQWSIATPSPLVHLLCHSDCDGVLTVEQCKSLAGPLLTTVLIVWNPCDYHWDMGTELIRCMINSIEVGRDLEFR